MSRARSLLFLAAATALFAGQAALRPAPRAPREAPPLTPAEASAALFLGGFRAIASDVLWVRLIDRYEAGRYEEVVPLAEAILALDPRDDRAWFFAASTLAVDLPSLEPPEARWPWVREGLALIRRGSRENPRSWLLRFYDGFLVWQHVAPVPALAGRFEAQEGAAPREYALRRFAEAAATPGHAIYVDWKLIRAALDLGRAEVARAALDHVRAAHPHASPEQIRAFAAEIERGR